MSDFDLETYLTLVELGGKVKIGDTPTPKLLKLLVNHHVTRVPYQNLDLVGVRGTHNMTPSSLLQRLLVEKRGGYCFELSDLMFKVLLELKFDARRLVSHSLGFFEPAGPIDNHAMIVVHLDGKTYLVDVGNGFTSIRDPLELDFGGPHETETSCLPFEKYRLELFDDHYTLNISIKDAWVPLYRFERPLKYLDEEAFRKVYRDCMHFPGHLPIRDSLLIVGILTENGRIGYKCGFHSGNKKFTKPYKKYLEVNGKTNTDFLDANQLRKEIARLVNVPVDEDQFENQS